MDRAASRLRNLLSETEMLYLPAIYDPLGARLVRSLGAKAGYVGGYVSGSSKAVSEPLLTMTEQVAIACEVARTSDLPIICDAGAGFGEPLHVTRTVREFISSGVAGIHIEDQLYPKRAHYHRYVAHTISPDDFGQKIRWAARERERIDPAFVLIARSDACREEGLPVALEKINRAADEGADYGLVFPRDEAEAEQAPKQSRLPLFYVQSRGNRDGRPVLPLSTLQDMGYTACIDAQLYLLAAIQGARKAIREVIETGDLTTISEADAVELRKSVEDVIGLDDYYAIEQQTVEK